MSFFRGVLGFTVYWEQSVMYNIMHDLCPLVWCRFSISGPRFHYIYSQVQENKIFKIKFR